jgi:hypothetical protein
VYIQIRLAVRWILCVNVKTIVLNVLVCDRCELRLQNWPVVEVWLQSVRDSVDVNELIWGSYASQVHFMKRKRFFHSGRLTHFLLNEFALLHVLLDWFVHFVLHDPAFLYFGQIDSFCCSVQLQFLNESFDLNFVFVLKQVLNHDFSFVSVAELKSLEDFDDIGNC